MTAHHPELPLLALETVAGGALPELFQREVDRVLENILDPNTAPDATRTITITVRITPDEGRRECGVVVEASSKIAACRGAAGAVYVGRRGGVPVALTNDVQQMALAFDAPRPSLPEVPTPNAAAK